MKTILRILFLSVLFCLGATLAILSFAPKIPQARPLKLAVERLQLGSKRTPASAGSRSLVPQIFIPFTSNTPTFGHPVISGIGGTGFEEDLRLDPSNPNRLYTSVPGTLSANTSWIWHSVDGGRTFKWIPNATALEGKVAVPCGGGGDTRAPESTSWVASISAI